MQRPRAADEVDEGVRLRIERRATDVLVPPVVRRKQASAAKIVIQLDGAASAPATGGAGVAPAAASKWLDWLVLADCQPMRLQRDRQDEQRE